MVSKINEIGDNCDIPIFAIFAVKPRRPKIYVKAILHNRNYVQTVVVGS